MSFPSKQKVLKKRSQARTWNTLAGAGWAQIAQDLLDEAASGKRGTRIIDFEESKSAAKFMRHMYELLWFFQMQKQHISMRLSSNRVIVTLRDRRERRGRRGIK